MLSSKDFGFQGVSGALRALGLMSALLMAANAPGQPSNSPASAKPAIGPPSAWVTPQNFDPRSAEMRLDSSADQLVLLVEREINAAENESFLHFVRQMRTVEGVQNNANVTVGFNPSYQSLTWHWVRVWRDGTPLNRLDPDKISLIRQERDLDQFVVNGEQSAMLVLDDVRVGDIVDYSYSLKGANPIFDGRFSGYVPVQLDQPAGRLLTRVFWPGQRRLFARAHGCSVQPALGRNKDLVEYRWDFTGVPAYNSEDSLPTWYDPEPWVQLSEFQTWAQVNQWAMELFQAPARLSPEVLQKLSEWKQIPDAEQQVLAALRFVQDEVRYFGIEIGASAQKPADPSTVFTRRFGDCKDKSLLFVTLLRALGVEAYPVLVSTSLRQTIDEWQPTASAFDHCIAVVRCNNQTYWLDPTAGYQRGSLAAHYLPNYSRGLVIMPSTAGLTAIPLASGLPLTTSTEYFQLAGKSGPSSLKVVTIAQGRDADSLRALFATTPRADIEKSYAHFYSELYPSVKTSSPLQMEDDQRQNQIKTTEFYTIDKIWSQSDRDGAYRCQFYPYTISALFRKPVDKDRKLPLAVAHPQHRILRTEVRLPSPWSGDSDNKIISGGSFFFRESRQCGGNSLVMEYEYRSLQDSVPAAQVADHLRKLDQAEKSLGYSLVWR